MQGEKKPTMKKAVVMSVSGIILVFAASLSLVGAAFEGYYQKKVLSLSKDKLCYLFRVTEDYDIENAFRRETERLSKIKIKCQNLCMILLVYMDQMGEYEKKALKDLSKANVVIQTVNPKISASALMIAEKIVSKKIQK